MLLALILAILLLNIGYGIRKVLDDAVDGKRAMAALGAICVIGVNAVIVWLVYTGISTSTDF